MKRFVQLLDTTQFSVIWDCHNVFVKNTYLFNTLEKWLAVRWGTPGCTAEVDASMF